MLVAARALKRAFSFVEQKIALKEHEGAGKGPWLMIAGRGATRGALRCYSAPGLDKVAWLTLEDGEQVDAAMLFVFADPESALPHLCIDVSSVGRDFAVFADLIPRVDLAVNAAYARVVYGPLHDVVQGLAKHPQLKHSPVPQTLLPFVSPWMVGFRLSPQLMPQLFELLASYVSHWLELYSGELPQVDLSPQSLRARDVIVRKSRFAREADPVWDELAHVAGEVPLNRVLEVLRNPGVPMPYSLRPPVAG
jgi:hypothetical protein